MLRLKHMIVSHHGTYEFGSPKLPMTPEAIALHYLDNLDAKVHSFTRDIREDRNQESAWTPFNQSLQRRCSRARSTARTEPAPPQKFRACCKKGDSPFGGPHFFASMQPARGTVPFFATGSKL